MNPERVLLRGMLWGAFLVALTSALRLAQDAAVAWRYGTGPVVDAFYFSLSIANWPVAVSLSTLTVLLAPSEVALRAGLPTKAQGFRAELLAAVLLAALAVAPVTAGLLYSVASSSSVGIGASAAAEVRAWAPAVAMATLAGILGALFTAWLVARSNVWVTLLEGVQPAMLLGAVLLAPGLVLFWGSAIGAVLQMLAMCALLWAAGALPAPRWRWASDSWRGFSKGALLVATGQVLFAFVPLLDPFFAVQLDEGSVSVVSYAGRLVLGLQGLAGLALQRSGLPLLAAMAASSPAALWRTSLRWATTAAACGTGLGLAVYLSADPLVALVFERGQFNAADRELVTKALRLGMLQMPPFLAGMVAVMALASVNAHLGLALVPAAGLFVKLVCSAGLAVPYGVSGLMVATALMYLSTMALAWWLLQRHVRAGSRGLDD